MTQQNDFGLTETQKEEIDEIALQRVRAMNSDEFYAKVLIRRSMQWKKILRLISKPAYHSI